jgi:rifampicin phosphotransferase
VQPFVEPDISGVWFGVDPVSGRTDRTVVAAVRGQPEGLVGGQVSGSRWVFDDRGVLVESHDPDGVGLDPALADRLRELGGDAAAVFGGPQDIEWAHIGDRLVLLQSRPVTTRIRGVPVGAVFGPGPVAETFPEPLAPLEVDLWVPALNEGLRDAIALSGSVSPQRLAGLDPVIVVDGRVAVDLELAGDADPPQRRRLRIGLERRIRRLRAAWRVGRLRVALPHVAAGMIADVDDDLTTVPPLDQLTARQLLALIARGRRGLRSLHAHEILLGIVAESAGARFTSASVAMRVLAEARSDGLDDATIVRRAPVVLALIPPRVGATLELPASVAAPDHETGELEETDAQVQREALRLRIRWLQELVGQAAFELGARLERRGIMADAVAVRDLTLGELEALILGRTPDAAAARARRSVRVVDTGESGLGLPARFRMSDRGLPIAVARRGGLGGGTGAGGGVGRGPVTHDADDPAPGSVLVVTTLRPDIGPELPRLAGIVSETGSVLSHLAILAREHGVAIVVDHERATQELCEGMLVTVHGDTGEVEIDRSDADADATSAVERSGRS